MLEFIPLKYQKDKALARTIESMKNRAPNRIETFGADKDRIYRGFLGEELFFAYMNDIDHQCWFVEDYNYDFITGKDKKIDVKTMVCESKPLENYMVNVQAPDLHKFDNLPPDYFVFYRILRDCSKAWLLGYKEFEAFKKMATFFPQGTKRGQITFTGDTWELEIKHLNKFMEGA